MMKFELTIDGKLTDPDSWHLTESLSAKQLKKLISNTCKVIEHEKQMKEEEINNAIRYFLKASAQNLKAR